VARTNDREVAVVERCQLGFTETLDDGKNGCVDETKREVTVTIEQFPDTFVVLRLEVDDFEPALLSVSKEAQKSIETKTLAGKPVQLDDDRRWDKHLLVSRLEEPCASVMVLVRAIHGRI
jgi:hypothetical protein